MANLTGFRPAHIEDRRYDGAIDPGGQLNLMMPLPLRAFPSTDAVWQQRKQPLAFNALPDDYSKIGQPTRLGADLGASILDSQQDFIDADRQENPTSLADLFFRMQPRLMGRR